jgi:hypothetical protein
VDDLESALEVSTHNHYQRILPARVPKYARVTMVEQMQRIPEEVQAPAKRSSLEIAWTVGAWIAWGLGPGPLLLFIFTGGEPIPAWLGPSGPLRFVSLLLTLGMLVGRGNTRRVPECWLLILYWVSLGIIYLSPPTWFMIACGATAGFAAITFPIIAGLRLPPARLRRRAGPPSASP